MRPQAAPDIRAERCTPAAHNLRRVVSVGRLLLATDRWGAGGLPVGGRGPGRGFAWAVSPRDVAYGLPAVVCTDLVCRAVPCLIAGSGVVPARERYHRGCRLPGATDLP